MARPRPKALLDALAETGIQTLENAPESKRPAMAASTQRHFQETAKGGGGGGGSKARGGGNSGGAAEARGGGGGVGTTLNIKCLNCAEEGIAMKARAYMEAPPMSVVLCANRLQDRREMEEALVHELVHVYDVRRVWGGREGGREGGGWAGGRLGGGGRSKLAESLPFPSMLVALPSKLDVIFIRMKRKYAWSSHLLPPFLPPFLPSLSPSARPRQNGPDQLRRAGLQRDPCRSRSRMSLYTPVVFLVQKAVCEEHGD